MILLVHNSIIPFLDQERRDEEALSLAVSYFTVVDGVCLTDPEEGFLSVPPALLEVLVGGEGPVDVPEDDLLVGGLLGHQDTVVL